MSELPDPFQALRAFSSGSREGHIYSLPALEKAGLGAISRLPVSIRIVLESVMRNCDGLLASEEDVRSLASWKARSPAQVEIPFVVSRILLQDFTGVPLLVDLAAMREAVYELGREPSLIEPMVPVDLVVDHSVQVDRSGTGDSFLFNLKKEFGRNRERYEFLKWGQQAFDSLNVMPPSIGIVHQVNLEYLAKVVFGKEAGQTTVFYPDTLVGTDSHTTMINGLGIIGWGVGGIEAEAGMLGQPVYILTPEVLGVNLTGEMPEGVTATDLTLRITELLRRENVVGKFVEFYGEGTAGLTVADRATIANMSPEYGATIGFFPVDEQTLEYLRITGRSEEQIQLVKDYFEAQGMFGIPREGEIDYTRSIELNLGDIVPAVAGPKRPQDRINLPDLKDSFSRLLQMEVDDGGYGLAPAGLDREMPVHVGNDSASEQVESAELSGDAISRIGNGSVLIAAITSCTNTSNPSVMIAAGLLAKKAVERGLKVSPTVKTSLAPGSRVVTEYLNETGLQQYLDDLGFHLVGYGCTTCIGNSGPLDPAIEAAISEGGLVAAGVLSGNRNFEARIHSSIKANFLMSPPLVVAFALAGRVDIDMDNEPLGADREGTPVYLRDLWPAQAEIQEQIVSSLKPEMFQNKYGDILDANPEWNAIKTAPGKRFAWKEGSTYIQNPPYFDGFGMEPGEMPDFRDMRPLAILGESVTTDHISPAGAIPADGPAGRYLLDMGVEQKDFNTFGARRGNDCVMVRGTFANVRIKNLMAGGREGGWTRLMPEGELMPIYDACQQYRERGIPLIVFGGSDFGMGSSRDWAAKGPQLLGVKAVVTSSFERIHRSNLIGMGVLPLQFEKGVTAGSLNLDGSETFSLLGLGEQIEPLQKLTLEIKRSDETVDKAEVTTRIDTKIEAEYFSQGGILPYVLRNILNANS